MSCFCFYSEIISKKIIKKGCIKVTVCYNDLVYRSTLPEKKPKNNAKKWVAVAENSFAEQKGNFIHTAAAERDYKRSLAERSNNGTNVQH